MSRAREAAELSNGKDKRPDLFALLASLVAAAGILTFLLIANRATDGEPGRMDESLLRSLREPGDPADPLGPRWLEDVGRDVTALGGYATLSLLVAFVAGYLLMVDRRGAAALVLGSSVLGLLLSHLLKEFYSRPRPDVVPHLVRVSSESFPSGHAMLAAVVYLTLGAVLARTAAGWWAKLYFVSAAAFVTILIGVSRVYLGVHYPTDVAAGWAIGVAWAVVCWLVERWLQRRGWESDGA
jgi:undecaprenyl-diphosphatase